MKAQAMIMPKKYFFDNNGSPLAFGKIYTYETGTTTPKITYTTEDGDVANPNPVILNGEGYATIYLSGSYNIVVDDQNDNNIWSEDPVSSNIAEEWVNCKTPAYVSTTSFKITGNVTDQYEFGRGIRVNNGVPTLVYSTIKTSSFSGGETTVLISDAIVDPGVTEVCVSIIGKNSTIGEAIYPEKTTATMAANTTKIYVAGDVVQTAEFSTGNGGGGTYDAVLTSTVTPNTFNIIIGVADALISFVLRSSGEGIAPQWGLVEGDFDNSAALVNMFANNSVINLGAKTFKTKTATAITLTQDTIIKADGGGLLTSIANGSLGDNIGINCASSSLTLNKLNVSGGSVSGYPFYVFANQETSGIVTINGGSYNNTYVNSGNSGNAGCYIRGGFEEVKVLGGAEFKNHSRAAGNGNAGVTGTSGLSITQLNTFDVKTVTIGKASFIDITNGEIADNANNTDADGLKIFSNVASNVLRRTSATISDCYFKNCKGRAVKTQNDITTVINPTIYRNIAGITGASVEIDLQIHGGDILSPTFIYEDETSGETTFVRPIAPISIFAAGTLKKPRISNISDVTIHDNTTLGTMGSALITATQSDLTSSFDSVINVTNVISTTSHASFMACPALTGTGKFFANIDNIYCKEIDAANGVFGFATSANIKASTLLSVSKFVHAGAETKSSYNTITPANLAKPTMRSNLLVGVSTVENGVSSMNNKITGIDENSDNTNDTGLHTYSLSIADTVTKSIAIPNLDNRGIAHISTNLSRFSCGVVSLDSSGALSFGAGAQSAFSAGGATDNNTANSLNVWATGGVLYIKNLLGSTRTITVNFQG